MDEISSGGQKPTRTKVNVAGLLAGVLFGASILAGVYFIFLRPKCSSPAKTELLSCSCPAGMHLGEDKKSCECDSNTQVWDDKAKTCVSCGGQDQPCCANGPRCSTGLDCGLFPNVCGRKCGDDTAPCCDGSNPKEWCHTGNSCSLTDPGASSCAAGSCGARGQFCCYEPSHPDTGSCAGGLTCKADNLGFLTCQ